MFYEITFATLSAMAVDLVDADDGFLFLRIVGEEPTINAIWARLMAKSHREKKYSSGVQIPTGTKSYRIAAQKAAYKTLRSRLPSGLVDLAIIHPRLTLSEDNHRGFYLVTYDQQIPSSWFARLNRSLAVPLKPEWSEWLWQLGQLPQTFTTRILKPVYQGGQRVERPVYDSVTVTPIEKIESLGSVNSYRIRCAGLYQEAWLGIIRQHLDVATKLDQQGEQGYGNGTWWVDPIRDQWQLRHRSEVKLTATTLDQLCIDARLDLGLNLSLAATATDGVL